MVLIRRVRRRWRLWVLVLAAAGLSACGGGSSGPGTESGTTSTTAGPPPKTVFTGHENAGWVDEVAFTSAPTLVSPVLTTDGQFHVTLVGKAGRSSTIQASTNLVNWIALTNFVSANGTNQFTDATAPNLDRRFYRAVTP